ncbi:hypothetical protein BGZ76_003793 [Entomortierella beljakovae]|nr:hypothetical protein BGZ76_003793 [Entomortierella beljakovae]
MPRQNPLELPEIQSHLARFISRHDLVQCIRVCKTWKESFLPHVWSYQKYTFSNRRPNLDLLKENRHWVTAVDIEPIHKQYALEYPRLHSLTIQNKAYGRVSEEWPLEMIKLNPTIAKLDVYPVNYAIPPKFMETVLDLANLEFFTLRYTSFSMVEDSMNIFWEICHKLKCLKLWGLRPNNEVSIPVDLICPCIEKLVLYGSNFVISNIEVDLISRCPQLTKLSWGTRELVTQETKSRFTQLCRLKTWPKLTRLRLNIPFEDDELEAILDSMVGATKLVLACKFEQRASMAIEHHFHSLEKLDLKECGGVPSTTLRDILCSCPRLLTLAGDKINAEHILQGGPWACVLLKSLRIQIVFKKEEHNDADLHSKIFERLGQLVGLEAMYLGNENCVYMSRDRGLDFRLGYGLEHLVNMKKLRHIGIVGTRQALKEEELDWISSNLTSLKQLSGILNKNIYYNAEFRKTLKARGINGS